MALITLQKVIDEPIDRSDTTFNRKRDRVFPQGRRRFMKAAMPRLRKKNFSRELL